jgi:hypothetical protein
MATDDWSQMVDRADVHWIWLTRPTATTPAGSSPLLRAAPRDLGGPGRLAAVLPLAAAASGPGAWNGSSSAWGVSISGSIEVCEVHMPGLAWWQHGAIYQIYHGRSPTLPVTRSAICEISQPRGAQQRPPRTTRTSATLAASRRSATPSGRHRRCGSTRRASLQPRRGEHPLNCLDVGSMAMACAIPHRAVEPKERMSS